MEKVKIAIIGAGFGGLCMGIQLKKAGQDDFIILEKADDLGGTWRENTYPGAECDIPSALYSYSFEHNSNWKFKWSGQDQILQYQHDTAEKYELQKHLLYKQEVSALQYDEQQQHWQVSTTQGQVYIAQHVVCAIGQLHKPATPRIKNADQFRGTRFHSAQWDHSIDLSGKRIGVIGNAASAVQFIPEIAKLAKHLVVYQRSPNWILAKIDRPYAKWEQRVSEKFPIVARIYRKLLWILGEYGVFPAIKGNRFSSWMLKKACLANLNKNVSDPELRKKLIPDYPVGAKRVLFSDHYYPALSRSNVSLNCQGVNEFTEQGIRDMQGVETEFDVVIYGTGFQTNPFLADISVKGVGGRSIREAWKDGAQAYLGVSTNGFPNLHLLYGPNTNLGHSSIIIMLEAQVSYIMQAILDLDRNEKRSCDVKPEIEEAYNHELQRRLSTMAFNQVAASWYKDGDKVTNNWVGGTREYVRRLKSIDMSAYVVK